MSLIPQTVFSLITGLKNQNIFNILNNKLNSMFVLVAQSLDSEPNRRNSTNEILNEFESWCIMYNDIIKDLSVQIILNQWTPFKHMKSELLHENIIHGFYKRILYDGYYKSKTIKKSIIIEHYPQFNLMEYDFKSSIESVYIYREMVDKLFYKTIDDEVFEGTISDHIDETVKTPQKLSELCNIDVCSLTCGERHVIARTKSVSLYSWGDNSCGQLGDGTNINRNRPKKICSFSHLNIIHVCCGAYHSLALTLDGDIFAWGYNRIGQIGNSQNKNNEWLPIKVDHPFFKKFKMISCGYHHSMALSLDGIVYSWGYNEFGQLGVGNNFNQDVPR